jgi:hypothetical protein
VNICGHLLVFLVADHVCFTIGDTEFVLVAATGTGARVKLVVTASSARFFGTILALMLVVSGAVRAGPVFSFDGHAGRHLLRHRA